RSAARAGMLQEEQPRRVPPPRLRERQETPVDQRHAEVEQIVSTSALLGYLNFSNGRPDPRWQKQLNAAYAHYARRGEPQPWAALLEGLRAHLRRLQAEGTAAFRDTGRAEAVLALAEKALPAYRRHHADLLAHLEDGELFGPFFLARVFEALLAVNGNGEEPE